MEKIKVGVVKVSVLGFIAILACGATQAHAEVRDLKTSKLPKSKAFYLVQATFHLVAPKDDVVEISCDEGDRIFAKGPGSPGLGVEVVAESLQGRSFSVTYRSTGVIEEYGAKVHVGADLSLLCRKKDVPADQIHFPEGEVIDFTGTESAL